MSADYDRAGPLIRYWRRARGLSQMALAHDVSVTPRHLSFVETGRSRPGRELVIRIAQRLGVQPAEENALLEAAGHARRHPRSDLSSAEVAQVRKVLRFMLERMEPNAALIFDAQWDIVMVNDAHERSRDFFLDGCDASEEVRSNLLRLTLHPDGLRPCIANWEVVAPVLVDRVERELAEAPSNHVLADLLEEVRSYGPVPGRPSPEEVPAGVLLPVHLRGNGVDIRIFTVLSTLGAAIDVAVQELRMETFFPADPDSERALAALAGSQRPLRQAR